MTGMRIVTFCGWYVFKTQYYFPDGKTIDVYFNPRQDSAYKEITDLGEMAKYREILYSPSWSSDDQKEIMAIKKELKYSCQYRDSVFLAVCEIGLHEDFDIEQESYRNMAIDAAHRLAKAISMELSIWYTAWQRGENAQQ